jgi:hypothetical protein
MNAYYLYIRTYVCMISLHPGQCFEFLATAISPAGDIGRLTICVLETH